MAESFVQIKTSFIIDKNFTVTEKLLFILLKSFAWDKNTCFPSKARLAEALGISLSTVKKSIKGLKEKGAISTQMRFTDKGGQTSNLYFLNVGDVKNEPKEKVPLKEKVEDGPSEAPKEAETGHSGKSIIDVDIESLSEEEYNARFREYQRMLIAQDKKEAEEKKKNGGYSPYVRQRRPRGSYY